MAKFSAEIIFDAIKDIMFFNIGKLKLLTQGIWNDAVVKMQNKMSTKHMYFSRNDHNIQDMLRKWHGIEQNLERSISEKNSSCDSNWSMDTSNESLPSFRVTITISGDDWNSIRVRDVSYKDRNYKIL